ncbi:hypothetical protein C8J56DRAFT_901586 [Mycena floridula]|nr:hypothetical protein C8J56DRAFT_901586 [Mycena floridula]
MSKSATEKVCKGSGCENHSVKGHFWGDSTRRILGDAAGRGIGREKIILRLQIIMQRLVIGHATEECGPAEVDKDRTLATSLYITCDRNESVWERLRNLGPNFLHHLRRPSMVDSDRADTYAPSRYYFRALLVGLQFPLTYGRPLIFGSWEWFTTLDFDFGFICGRRKFKWPMIFYFYARYAFLASLVGTIFLLNNGWQVNCQALYMTILLLGHSALWASGVSLSIRTMTLWGYSRRIMVIIVPLIAFHLVAVCLSSSLDLSVVWAEVAFAQARCVSIDIADFGIASLYTYNVVLDFIILCLTLYKLLYGGGARIRIKRIPIFMLLFRDGLVYFVVVFIVTLFPVVYIMLDRNIAVAIGMHVIPGTATSQQQSRRWDVLDDTRYAQYPYRV